MRRLLASLVALSLLGGAIGCRPCIMGICDCGNDHAGVHCSYGCGCHHTMPAYLTQPPQAEPIKTMPKEDGKAPPVKGDGL